MKQREFLRLAKRVLGLTYRQLADELGVASRTMEKWSLAEGATDFRSMPLMAWKFIVRLLAERKSERLSVGDQAAAETIDALLAHASAEGFGTALRTFDRLQRAAATFSRMRVDASKPRYFRTVQQKNAWEAEEEVRHARRVREATAHT